MKKKMNSLFPVGMLCFILIACTAVICSGKTVYAEDDMPFDGFYSYNFSNKSETVFDVSIPESTPDELVLDGAPGAAPGGSDDANVSSGGASTYSVIGSDGRYQGKDTTLRPNRWVAYLVAYWSDGTATRGTAWMYGPSVAVTAGHCIYSKKLKSYPEKIVVYPAYNEGEKPYGSYRVTRASVPKKYRTTTDIRYDIGIVKLSSAVGKQTGYFSIRYTSGSYKGQSVYIAGYPGSKGTGLWKMQGTIAKSEKSRLYYQIDTSDGQSGAPIYYGSGSKRYCIGIHTHGTTDTTDGYNSGTRITKTIYYWLKDRREAWS